MNAEAIYDLSAFGVLGGYDDGTFRPGNPVLRAQYAKMITIALAIHDAVWAGWNHPHFPDVPRPATQAESARYPFDFVEEAGAAATSAFQNLGGLSLEAKAAMALCYENGIIFGKAPGVFGPYERNHVALMTWRFMKALGMAE